MPTINWHKIQMGYDDEGRLYMRPDPTVDPNEEFMEQLGVRDSFERDGNAVFVVGEIFDGGVPQPNGAQCDPPVEDETNGSGGSSS